MAPLQCSVEIRNHTSKYILTTPGVFKLSGSCEVPLPPMLFPGSSDKALFKQAPDCKDDLLVLFGFGLVSPDPKDTCGVLAVLFDVPYDRINGENVVECGIFDLGTKCDASLFNAMHKGKEVGFVRAKAGGDAVKYKSSDLFVTATMSESGDAVLKVDISDVNIKGLI